MDIRKSFRVPTEVKFAASCASLRSMIKFDSEDLIVTDERIYKLYLEPHLNGARVLVRENYGSGPLSDEVITQAAHDAGTQCRRVIGIGGGGVLDLAKIMSLEQSLPIERIISGDAKLIRSRYLILIPSTPGSGSEVTPYCAVQMQNLGAQYLICNHSLYADEAVLCPELLHGIPFNIIAASSFDAFIHAFESYLSPLATVFSQSLACSAISNILRIWKNIGRNGVGSIKDELSGIQEAGTLAGLSYANAGCAAVHALAYPLSLRLHIPHGEANYLVFSAVLETYCKKQPQGQIKNLAKLIAAELECRSEEAFTALSRLCNAVLPRRRLSAYGMTEDQILDFTDIALTRRHLLLANGYVQLSVSDIADIYRSLL